MRHAYAKGTTGQRRNQPEPKPPSKASRKRVENAVAEVIRLGREHRLRIEKGGE